MCFYLNNYSRGPNLKGALMTTCDLCDKPSVFHDVRIVNGVHNTVNLCHEHAVEAGYNVGSIDLSILVQIPKLLVDPSKGKSCPECGMTISHYKKTSLLGCPTCYKTFADQLSHIIANVQDNHEQHVGRAPTQFSATLDRHLMIRRLLKQLDTAVNQEEYEQAAILRDKLRELHDSGDQHEN